VTAALRWRDRRNEPPLGWWMQQLPELIDCALFRESRIPIRLIAQEGSASRSTLIRSHRIISVAV
jgi:hypothetical protein